MCGATIFGKTYETTLNLSIVLYLHVWWKTRVKSSVKTPNTKASNPISMNLRIFVKMMRTSFHAVTSEVDLDEILKTVGGRLDSQADDLDANTTRGCMTKEQQQYQGNNSTKNEEDRTQAGIDELEVAHSGSKSGSWAFSLFTVVNVQSWIFVRLVSGCHASMACFSQLR